MQLLFNCSPDARVYWNLLVSLSTTQHLSDEQLKLIVVWRKFTPTQQKQILEEFQELLDSNRVSNSFWRTLVHFGILRTGKSITESQVTILSQNVKILKQHDLSISKNMLCLYYNALGFAYNDLEEYDLAHEMYSKALELNPTYALCLNNRGSNLLQSDRNMEAIEDITLAIELNRRYTASYFNRAIAYWRTYQDESALVDLSRVIELDSEYFEAYEKRATAYDETGLLVLALRDHLVLAKSFKLNIREAMVIRQQIVEACADKLFLDNRTVW